MREKEISFLHAHNKKKKSFGRSLNKLTCIWSMLRRSWSLIRWDLLSPMTGPVVACFFVPWSSAVCFYICRNWHVWSPVRAVETSMVSIVSWYNSLMKTATLIKAVPSRRFPKWDDWSDVRQKKKLKGMPKINMSVVSSQRLASAAAAPAPAPAPAPTVR